MPNHRLLLAAAASACVAVAPGAHARDLTIALRPGPFADAVRQAYLAPFTASSGVAVLERRWDGGLDALRRHAGTVAAATSAATGSMSPGTAAPAPSATTTPAAVAPGTAAATAAGTPPASATPTPGAPPSGTTAPPSPPGTQAAAPPPATPPATPPDWDVVALDGDELAGACAASLVQTLDWSRLGGRDHYLAQATSPCGVGATLRDTVLAWDRDKVPGTPSWADFWDVAKHPGKRGLPRGPRLTLEIALLADGVAAADVYATLRTEEGVDRAFRKLDQLKPYLVWWDRPEQAPQLLASGEALLTAAASDAVVAANAAPRRTPPTGAPGTSITPPGLGATSPGTLSMSWAASLQSVASWAILRASPETDAAYALLASMGDPHRQAVLGALLPLGGTAKGATEGLTPEQLAASPAAPANLAATLPVDEAFWHDNQDRLERRYAAWLAR